MEIREPAVTAQTGSATVPRPLTTGRAGVTEKTGGASTKNVPKNRQGGFDIVDLSAVGHKNSAPVESRQAQAGITGSVKKNTNGSGVAGQAGKPDTAPQPGNAVQDNLAQVGSDSGGKKALSRRDYTLDQGDLVVKIVTNGEVVREIPTEDQRKIKQAIKKYVNQSSPGSKQGNGAAGVVVANTVTKSNTGGNVGNAKANAAQSAQAGAAKTDSDGDNDANAEAGEAKE